MGLLVNPNNPSGETVAKELQGGEIAARAVQACDKPKRNTAAAPATEAPMPPPRH
jgi:hypothetical protein